jgi:tetratricopeptide (TPR) repeat protein/predicted Ser/Thr protein kinase
MPRTTVTMNSPAESSGPQGPDSDELGRLAPDLLASFEGQRQRAAVLSGLFGELEERPAIGRFTLLRKLGSGGMGVVYAAYDPQLDRTIALKLLRGRDGEQASLLREAKLLAQLSHPNVVTVFDVGEVDGQVYVAMEYLAGETLRAWCRHGPRPWRQTLPLVLQAGHGLAAAHAAGIVHRDFKPDNTIIEASGRVRVLDFGLAAASEVGARASVAGGTLGYVAPEQRAGRGDARSDQYSFCVTLYEALHGVRPDVAGPRRRDVPTWLTRAVERGLQRDPDARWPSLGDLLAELEAAPHRRRRRWQAVGLAGLFAGGLAAAWALPWNQPRACSGLAELAEDVWSGPRRAAVEQAMLATGVPSAAQAFAAVDQQLREHASTWATTYHAACSAYHRSELSADTYERAIGCLLARRAEARALVAALASGGEDAVLRGPQGAGALARPDRCLSAAAAGVLAPVSAAPETERVREELAAARVDRALARYQSARVHAHAGLDAAQRLAAPALVAEAMLVLGQVESNANKQVLAERLLTRAYFRALAIDHAPVAARAALGLVAIVGFHQRDLARAEYWESSLAALVERLGDDEELAADADANLALVRFAQGRHAEALSACERAIARSEVQARESPVYVEELARALDLRAEIRVQSGDAEGALADMRRSLAIREAAFGPEYVHLATSLNNLAKVYIARGELAEARTALERAIELSPGDAAFMWMNLCEVHLAAGDDEDALVAARRALTLAETEHSGERAAAGARSCHGSALVAVGRVQEGVHELRLVLQDLRKRHGPRALPTGQGAFNLGQALRIAGELDEAESLLRLALDAYTALPPEWGAAEIESELARLAEARASSRDRVRKAL